MNHVLLNPLELLSDALDRVIASPSSSHTWENLTALSHGVGDVSVRDQVVRLLRAQVADTGLPAFYRALYLDLLTDAPEHLVAAARALQETAPVDADRLARFHYFAWQRMLMRPGAQGLAERLLQAGLPAMAAQLGAALARAAPGRIGPRPIGRVQRVAVVSPYLLTPLHPPTAMALDQCAVLAQQGCAVELFTCQESVGPGFEHLLANTIGVERPAIEPTSWLQGRAWAPRRVHVADDRFSLLRRGAAMLDSIGAFDPDLVMFVGMQSLLSASLYAARPVVALCVNSMAPMVPADVLLTTHQAADRQWQRSWGEAFPPGLGWYHPWRVWRQAARQALARADLGLQPAQVALVTVGSQLGHRIQGAWAQAMADALRRHPHLVWVLVGDDGALPPALAAVPPAQMRLLPRSDDVPAVLACADIYLHPPIPGGGFAVAEAMSHGLPVLALAGADGGDKLGDDALPDQAGYMALLDALAHDAQARQLRGERHRQHFAARLDLAQSGPSLVAAAAAALAGYQRRTGEK